MHRDWIREKLNQYQPTDEKELVMKKSLEQFIENNPDCFKRELMYGHVVGSAWVVNAARDKVLLTHHLKLNKWIQFGGHSDGQHNTLDVALREAQEESGLQNFKILSDQIFDLDVHTYPARETKYGFEPNHLHFDLRFILEADENETPHRQEEESNAVAWIPLDKLLEEYRESDSLRRMRDKTYQLFSSTSN